MNIPGTVGFVFVLVATVYSPACLFVPLAAVVLVPVGLIGLMFCGGSLSRKPRWAGVAGLVVGGLCLGVWTALFAGAFS